MHNFGLLKIPTWQKKATMGLAQKMNGPPSVSAYTVKTVLAGCYIKQKYLIVVSQWEAK